MRVVEHDVEHTGDLLGNVELHGERVGQRAIVGLRPQMDAVGCADQLRGDARMLALAPHAAFEHVADAELLTDGTQILALALELERRRAADDEHAVDACE